MDLSYNSKLSRIALLLLTATAASSLGIGAGSALADDKISEKDMLTQAVQLYEKLSGTEVAVPQSILNICGDTTLGKAVVLGFANADEINAASDKVSLRKQDALTVLYKTLIDFDDSFALASEEVDEIMNGCYDNALIDEENRVAFAFMLKYGIIDSGYDTEPDKKMTWQGCRVFVNELYNRFMQDVEFNVGGLAVKIGANIDTVTDVLGTPSRIDKGDYGIDWYVFNSDYNYFVMVGVDNGRICSFFSNAISLTFDDVKMGDDGLSVYDYTEDDGYRFLLDNDGKIDGVLFITRQKSDVMAGVSPQVRAFELIDMINAYRVKNNMPALSISQELTARAQAMAGEPQYLELARDARYVHNKNGAQHETGYDTFTAYSVAVNAGGACTDTDVDTIGVGTALTEDDYSVLASIIAADSSDISNDVTLEADETGLETATPQQQPDDDEDNNNKNEAISISDITSNSDVTALPIDDPPEDDDDTDTELPSSAVPQIFVNADNDVVIDLSGIAAKEYYVKVYSFEDDTYLVNSYITAKDNMITFEGKQFDAGKDYSISLSEVNSEGVASPDEFIINYGDAPEDALSIVTPEDNSETDDDYISLSWNSPLYHDFVVDIYDEDRKLIMTKTVIDSNSANIRHIEPGEYTIKVSALRRGTDDIIKAVSQVHIDVKLPEPIINEYILNDGERFYPVYEDEELGLVCFYDEDITDGKKKITEKWVKATDYYKLLANAQQKVEYFTGSPYHDLILDENGVDILGYSGLSIDSSSMGNAAVREATKYLGIKYLWGGTTPNGFDCSGFTQYVYKQLGINIERVSQAQYHEQEAISRENLQPGDLVFFKRNGDVHHVGIYVGSGMMIHSPYTGTVIQYQSIDEGSYRNEFCGGRRIYSED